MHLSRGGEFGLICVSRDQLRENALLKKYYCDVNIGDLIKFNEEIAHRLVTEPAEIIPLVRKHPLSFFY